MVATAMALSATSASAGTPRKLIFPMVGATSFTNDFGVPRPQGLHLGNDLIGPWRAPVVAVESGTVTLWTASWRAGCMLWLNGDSGTRYAYIHLNNDLTDRNDNKAGCQAGIAYAPLLKDGQRVEAGELLGYNGDSGDANGGVNHVHFELQKRRGVSVSPYKWLKRAKQLIFPVMKHVGPEGIAFKIHGTIMRSLQTEAGAFLVIHAHFLRASDGSRYRVDRKIFTTVVPETILLKKKGRKRARAKLGAAKRGHGVTVWTAHVQPTLDTALGRKAALMATKVLVKSKRR